MILALSLIIGLQVVSDLAISENKEEIEASKSVDLLLRCDGAGTKQSLNIATVNSFDSYGGIGSSMIMGANKEKLDERVLVDIHENIARIRFPRSLLPPYNNGSKDGWWELTDVSVSDEAISARFRLNFANKPAVRIDRLSGDIEVTGFAKFRGECQTQSRSERRF